jgi:hypothetical protein
LKKFLITWLFFQIIFVSSAFSEVSFLNNFPKKSYREVYSDSRLIGKTESAWREKAKGRLEFLENSSMQIQLFGKSQEITTRLSIITDEQLAIQSFDYEMTSADSNMKVEGQRSNNLIRLKKTQSGSQQVKEIPLQEPILLLPLVRPFLLKEGLLKSKNQILRSAQLLEPAALALLPMSLTASPKPKGYSVVTRYLSQVLESDLDQRGELIEERTDFAGVPLLEKTVSRDRYQASKVVGMGSDLVERVKVSFPKLKSPRDLAEFTVKLDGIPLHYFQLNRHRQRLESGILTVTKEASIESAPVQSLVGRKDLEKYLVAEVSVPVFDPRIQKKAREIVGKRSDLWERAKAVHQFVFSYLKKEPYVSLPDAIEALETGKGDCNEHATLYTALARAAGVPTRTVVGLVYADSFFQSNSPGFYYHAWVEVYTGKQWVAIDPTWNQIPADATHLAFIEGGADQQIQIAAVMGKVKLSPVDPKAIR